MKQDSLAILLVAILLQISVSTQAQPIETEFNQVELMKQFIGSWKYENPDGSSMIFEITPFGSAMTGNTKFISKDTIFDQNKYLWGYDKKSDKIILAEIFNNSPAMEIDILWFTSKTSVDGVLQKDIANPEKAVTKFHFEFMSEDSFVLRLIQNNIIAAELKFNRVKM